jgi:hypothetical protein
LDEFVTQKHFAETSLASPVGRFIAVSPERKSFPPHDLLMLSNDETRFDVITTRTENESEANLPRVRLY